MNTLKYNFIVENIQPDMTDRLSTKMIKGINQRLVLVSVVDNKTNDRDRDGVNKSVNNIV